MPNTCATCDLPQLAYIDRLVLAGHPLLRIARELRISYPSLRAHNAHGHPRRGHPTVRPEAADWYVASDAEEALFAEVDEKYVPAVAESSGVPIGDLWRCMNVIRRPDHHSGCAACQALISTDGLWLEMLEAHEGAAPPPAHDGRWVSQAEAERLEATGAYAAVSALLGVMSRTSVGRSR